MRLFVKKLCLLTALVATLMTSVPPEKSAAETTGLGWDGYTRQMFRAANGIGIINLDSYLVATNVAVFGPYVDWTPLALTTGNNSYSYVLWRDAAGHGLIWLVDPNLNYVASTVTANYVGWTPEDVSTGTLSSNLRLTWRRYDGAVAVMAFDAILNFQNVAVYGPYAGYDPGPAPEAVVRSPASLRRVQALPNSPEVKAIQLSAEMLQMHAASAQRAAKAMLNHVPTGKFPRLPTL